ncbi:MAG TPA: ATP-binding protein [Solirubrobacteraceae bacterium]|jgi:PAS domain S-box-containing protein|nr:ATP-binding protein [Solirubrobacteraceae bacterium]
MAEDPDLGPEHADATSVCAEETPPPGELERPIAHHPLLELIPDAFLAIAASGEIMLANAQTEALFGYPRGQLVGRPVELLLPERFAAMHRAHRAGYFADPRPRPMGAGLELAGRRRDGSEFPAEISLSSIELDGTLLATAAIRDISERIAVVSERDHLQVEAEKERLQNQLQHSRRLESLGELAGGIAHDFNNLLAVIINYATFVGEDLDSGAYARDLDKRRAMRADVEQISVAAERAAHLTHQLLAFARREVVQPDVVDVNSVVTAVGQLLKRTLGEHIELRHELDPDLRPVLIDLGQLEQILVNLAINARDAMPDGGVLTIDTANVELDTAYTAQRPELTPGRYVRVRVSDTGVGMPREVVERAFDPFFTTKPAGQGTGLGLATVYGIVQQAGGRAQIYSETGVGTTFTALLPPTQEPPASPPRAVDPSLLQGDATILLVEDEPALRDVTRRILTGGGYRVIAAEDGVAALAVAGELTGPIDLLLTDVIMPHMNGPQLAERIRRSRPTTVVMFMSGFAQPILDSGGHVEEGAVLIEKPFSGSGLLAKVGEALNREGNQP